MHVTLRHRAEGLLAHIEITKSELAQLQEHGAFDVALPEFTKVAPLLDDEETELVRAEIWLVEDAED